MEERAKLAIKLGDKLFDQKGPVNSLMQEIALNFYPERADFTTRRNDGDEFAEHLYSSYPVLARRELGNLMASALRPRSQKWFSIHVNNEDLDEGDAERAYLEHLTDIQWRAMYDAGTGITRATKQADHDFASFGNAVIRFGPNTQGNGLLFRNYHLRDCVWSENAEGAIDALHRKWCPTARQLMEIFPKTASKQVQEAAQKEPEREFNCRHIVLPARLYDYKSGMGKEFPFVSLYVECESETVLEETGLGYFNYVVPRWHTIAGSVYGVSMATAIILPDGRTMQVMVRTIRDAGEKYVNPPMIAVTDAVRGDIALYAGGVTTIAEEYNEKTGEALRPLNQDAHGMPLGFELAAALREDINSGFFLDKIQMPEAGTDMTAYEVRRRLEEHIRGASPIFEPIEQEYNDPLCEGVFNVLRDHGAFPMEEMPETLQGQDVHFSFRSPLAEMSEQKEAETFIDVRDRILMPLLELDPSQLEQVDWNVATRDAMRAGGFKQKWFKPIEAVAQAQAEAAEAAKIQKGVEAAAAAGAVAEQGGKGMEALGKAGVV